VSRVREQLRELALSLPGAVEEHPWGEDVVKVAGKVFVFLGTAASRRMTVKLDESLGHALSVQDARPAGYGLGRSGWVTVPLEAEGIDLDLLRDWIEESYRIVAPRRLVARLDAVADAEVHTAADARARTAAGAGDTPRRTRRQ
jgi:predicted DNA-binding protein (MmcQ/YjbR family)